MKDKRHKQKRDKVNRRIQSGELHFLSFDDEDTTSNKKDQMPEGYKMTTLTANDIRRVGDYKVVAKIKDPDSFLAPVLDSVFSSMPYYYEILLFEIYEGAIKDAVKEFGWICVREHITPNLLVARWRLFDPAGKSALIYYDIGDEFEGEAIRLDCDPNLKTFNPLWLRIKRNIARAYRNAGNEPAKRGRPKKEQDHINPEESSELSKIADRWEHCKILGYSDQKIRSTYGYSRSQLEKARALRKLRKL